jgi:threonine-phosphate decarboxylase
MNSVHGGDVSRVSAQTGIPVERILDFSANVNPLGLPACALEQLERDARDPRLLMQYPDPEASELRRVLGQRLHVPVENIVIGAGADALIHAAVRALAPQRCLIPVLAFSEYERAARACGCPVHRGKTAQPADLVVLNNPHNPTGACVSRTEMLERIRLIRAAEATVLADEAFIDYIPEAAITRDAASIPGVVAVRSLTKFFGCPGLRVGYAVAAPETAAQLAAQLSAWPVTTLALKALTAALGDQQYIRSTLENNRRARGPLVAGLERLGCRPLPPAANFILFEVPAGVRASEIREQLIRQHAILVRNCDSFDGLEPGRYLRIAVRTEDENSRLLEALASVLGDKI